MHPVYAVSPDGATAYTVAGSQLIPISLTNGAIGTPVPLPTAYDASPSCSSGGGENGLAVSLDGSTVAIACGYADVDLVNLTNGTVTTVPLNQSSIGAAEQVAFTPDGRTVVVSWNDDIHGGQVSLIDAMASPPSIMKTLILPGEADPQGVAVTPDGTTALVSGYQSAHLFVVHLDTSPASLDSTTVPTGGIPDLIAFAVPPPVGPTVTSMLPSAGSTAGGTSVEVFGSGFAGSSPVSAVYFGATQAASYTVDSDSEITAVTPAESAGTVDITVRNSAGASPTTGADQFTFAAPANPEPYNPVSPSRICDTRTSQSQTACPGAGTLGPGSTLTVQAGGNGGIPASGVTAIVVNVTVTDTTAPSFLTLYPAGSARPTSSNLNWAQGQTVPNMVTVGLSSQGAFDVYNYAGSADVVIDVEGYYAAASAASGGLYNALTPARICDTRPGNPSQLSGTGLTQCEGHAPAPGTSLTIKVPGLGGVPSTGAEAAVLNVTAIAPSTSGYLTVYPAGGSVPLASSVNYAPGEVVPNRIVVPLSSSGQISIFSSGGSPDVAVDVSGWISSSSASSGGATFTPAFSPTRICDTRSGLPYTTQCASKTLGQGGSLAVTIAGVGGVPSNATAVVLNVTVTDTSASSYLSVYPQGASQPMISDLNWTAGRTVPNLVVAAIGANGQIVMFNHSGGADAVVDVVGWYQ